jgi:nucleotide-binding universal stress UspA family protein
MSNEIVVGLDDTPSSKLALEWAAQQARSTDAVLRAVHVSSSELEDTYRQVLTAMFEGVPASELGSGIPEWVRRRDSRAAVEGRAPSRSRHP